LTVNWAVDLHGLDQVTGTVSDGNWTAELGGDRAVFNASTNAAPWASRHTIILTPGNDPEAPGGDGWGTLRVTASGAGILSASLPDGTRLARKAPLSKNGDWPLYAALYRLQGSLVGWIHFDTNSVSTDLQGPVDWFRPTQPTAIFYPAGFTNRSQLTGSRYVIPATATNRIIELTDGALVLTGGNLSQDWTNTFMLGANNRVTNTSPESVSFALSRGTGLFKGRFLDPISERAVAFAGAVLQKSTNGAGYFLGTNQSGRVALEAR
jgi:hypothetical protein